MFRPFRPKIVGGLMRSCLPLFLLTLTGGATVYAQQAVKVPVLNTRLVGSDWPTFLGPTGDSVSSEKGLILPWPKTGPRIVWKVGVSEGYGPPSISKGRLFVCDRVENNERLRCLQAETGEFLWKFE